MNAVSFDFREAARSIVMPNHDPERSNIAHIARDFAGLAADTQLALIDYLTLTHLSDLGWGYGDFHDGIRVMASELARERGYTDNGEDYHWVGQTMHEAAMARVKAAVGSVEG